MSVRLIIDPLDFARTAGSQHDKIPLSEFARLQDFLFDKEGEIIYRISGRLDHNKKPGLHLEIKGRMHLCCQRCLDKLAHTVELEVFLLLAKSEAELDQADDDDTVEAILATPDLDVIDLIEDEIILGLAMSSRHADNECSTHRLISSNDNQTDNMQPAHPFAALAALKKTS